MLIESDQCILSFLTAQLAPAGGSRGELQVQLSRSYVSRAKTADARNCASQRSEEVAAMRARRWVTRARGLR